MTRVGTTRNRVTRAHLGVYLNGPLPTIPQLRKQFGLSRSAASMWHVKLKQARKEFAA